MNLSVKAALLSLCFCLVGYASFAQHFHYQHYHSYGDYGEKGHRIYQRYQLGVQIPSQTVNFEQHYVYPGYNTYQATGHHIDTTFRGTYKSSKAWGITLGTFFPLAKLGKETSLVLDVCLQANIYHYSAGTVHYDSSTFATCNNGDVLQGMLPITLALKTGGDATLNRNNTFMFTAGVGLAPGFAGIDLFGTDIKGNVRPFLMTEFGFFAGIAFKFRGTFFLGDYTLANTDGSNGGSLNIYNNKGGSTDGDLSINAIGHAGYNIALIIMPYSWHWSSEKSY